MPFPDAEAAEAAFYAAFRDLDITGMKTVWLDSSDASCIHPGGGLLRGADAILASWAEMFRHSRVPQVSHRLIQATADRHLEVHTVEEQVSSGSGQRSARILATNVYARSDGGWQMLAHHASLPLVEPQGEQAKSSSLH
jgi:ketosteroid isomerase-like protein